MRKFLNSIFWLKPMARAAGLACALGVAVLPTQNLQAQQTATYWPENERYNEALDLFEKEKYAASLDAFQRFILENPDGSWGERRTNAEFYRGICQLYLFHKDAEYNLEKFVQSHPDSPWVPKVYAELAFYNYKRRKYKKALEWFVYVDEKTLSEQDKIAFHFKRGDSYFKQKEFEKARTDFYEVLGKPSEYEPAAQYYYAHLAYVDKNYQSALEGFQKLESDPNFAALVPYYITQIYYLQERYDQVLSYAPALLDSGSVVVEKRVPEIAQMIGDSYYRQANYTEALPYLELYHEEADRKEISAEESYQLGFTYFNTGDYTAALDAFNLATKEKDELSQRATYQMANCYMKLEQKEYARSAFKKASEMEFDLEIKEDALFNYAKLAFELSYNPFHEAIRAFEAYLENYPDSPRRDEAYEFLLNVYMKTRNYEQALVSLDRIQNKDTRTKEAYQVVTFNRAVQLLQSKKYGQANAFFDKVADYPINQQLIAESVFWKGEIAYAMEDFDKAARYYQNFVKEPGSTNTEFFNEANYSAGYALFKQKKYLDANSSFRRFADNFGGDDRVKLNDAYLRIGDCFYVSKQYDQGINYYNKAIALADMPNKDYAMFQKAVCYGYKKDAAKQVQVLQTLLDEQNGSKYTVDAKYQLAKGSLEAENLSDALLYFNDIVDNHPTSPYVKKSLNELALVYLKMDRNDKVLEIWDKITTKYRNDKVMKDVFDVVKDVLLAERGPEELQKLQGEFSVLDISTSQIEEDTYLLAYEKYALGDCSEAMPAFENYLAKFQPNAIHAADANYWLAECNFEAGLKDKALEYYNFVTEQPIGDYTEASLVAAATINFNNKNYEQALNHYLKLEGVAVQKNNVLEAEIGAMRCYIQLEQLQYVKDYADRVIQNEDTPPNFVRTARMYRGKALFKENDWDNAYTDFAEIAKTVNAEGAEAKYYMCQIAYNKGAYKAAETEIFEMVQTFSNYDEFKYKSFLLLADVYIKLDDLFQAKTTLTTIVENVTEDWVIQAAFNKLDEIEALENEANETERSDEIEINLNEDTQEDGQ